MPIPNQPSLLQTKFTYEQMAGGNFSVIVIYIEFSLQSKVKIKH